MFDKAVVEVTYVGKAPVMSCFLRRAAGAYELCGGTAESVTQAEVGEADAHELMESAAEDVSAHTCCP